jgi:signal transduction histidine kinase
MSARLLFVMPFFILLHVADLLRSLGGPPDEAGEREQNVVVARSTDHAELASLLHDTVGQGLTAISLQVRNASKVGGEQQLKVIDQVTTHTMTELRVVIQQLRHGQRAPSAVADEGLVDVVNRFRSTGLPIDFLASGSDEQLSPTLRKVIVRVAREALSNATKYAPNAPVSIDFEVSKSIKLRLRSCGGVRPRPRFAGVVARKIGVPWAGGGQGSRMMQRLVTQQGGLICVGSDQRNFSVVITFPREDLGAEQASEWAGCDAGAADLHRQA